MYCIYEKQLNELCEKIFPFLRKDYAFVFEKSESYGKLYAGVQWRNKTTGIRFCYDGRDEYVSLDLCLLNEDSDNDVSRKWYSVYTLFKLKNAPEIENFSHSGWPEDVLQEYAPLLEKYCSGALRGERSDFEMLKDEEKDFRKPLVIDKFDFFTKNYLKEYKIILKRKLDYAIQIKINRVIPHIYRPINVGKIRIQLFESEKLLKDVFASKSNLIYGENETFAQLCCFAILLEGEKKKEISMNIQVIEPLEDEIITKEDNLEIIVQFASHPD